MPKELKFPVVRPDVPEPNTWKPYLDSLYASNQFSNFGQYWIQLAREVENYFPSSTCIPVANNTLGQVSVLQGINVRNKKVMLSNFTFSATLHAVIQAGGIPCLLDVDPISGELTIETISKGIREFGKPEVVIYTRTFGARRQIDAISEFLVAESIKFLVDAAAGFPTQTDQTQPNECIEVFSFHATKALGIGEAGAIVGNSSMMERIKQATNFGFASSETFRDGTNAKLDEFSCIRALAGLKEYSRVAEARQKFVSLAYASIYSTEKFITLENDGSWGWSLFPIKFDAETTLDKFARCALSLGLSGKRYYFPSMQQGYVGTANVLKVKDLSQSEAWARRTYCLPTYGRYSQAESEEIALIVQRSLEQIC
jgi:dTDP-4-amino-4,6-dideoxygalactose transaminase